MCQACHQVRLPIAVIICTLCRRALAQLEDDQREV
jgi:hypothetical protein